MRTQKINQSSYCKGLVVFVSLVLSGCTIAPTPISTADQQTMAMLDRAAASKAVEPLNTSLTLSEALARGLKYNLNHRTKMMEQAMALGQWDMSRYDMLPKLTAAAGYNWRNNERITNSTDSVTGLPSLANPYISSERIHTATDLGLTWNLLDFGVSYQVAKQNADRVLVAAEYRRKAMHLLMQDISTVYWRAMSAQKIERVLRDTIQQAEAALSNSQRVESDKVRDPVEALRYQRTVLENLRILESIKREMSTAKIELAALINLPLSANFELAEPENDELNPRYTSLAVEKMEEIAIRNNADLRSEFYNARIAVAETKKSLLKLFPGISFNYSRNHDSDDYLINNSWREAGAKLSWNLFSMLSVPATLRSSQATIKLAEQRRIATQMAVLAQVHLSRYQYDSAYALFKRADAIWRVDQRIYAHTLNRESANVKSQLDRVLNGTSAVVSLLRRYQALSDVYAASSTVKATLGVDPVIDDLQMIPLPILTGKLKVAMDKNSWNEPLPPIQPQKMVTQTPMKRTSYVNHIEIGNFQKNMAEKTGNKQFVRAEKVPYKMNTAIVPTPTRRVSTSIVAPKRTLTPIKVGMPIKNSLPIKADIKANNVSVKNKKAQTEKGLEPKQIKS
jgi:outer membrane protein TolC